MIKEKNDKTIEGIVKEVTTENDELALKIGKHKVVLPIKTHNDFELIPYFMMQGMKVRYTKLVALEQNLGSTETTYRGHGYQLEFLSGILKGIHVKHTEYF